MASVAPPPPAALAGEGAGPTFLAPAETDDRQRHSVDRRHHRRAATLAAHRHDELVPRRRRERDPSRGRRKRRVPGAQRRSALVRARDGTPMNGVRTLHPAYFALVMATGIVSIAAKLMGMSVVAWALLVVNIIAFVVLWILTLIRIARFPGYVFADLIDHQRGVGFFTVVAATSVLGSQIVVLAQSHRIAAVLWFATLALWLV